MTQGNGAPSEQALVVGGGVGLRRRIARALDDLRVTVDQVPDVKRLGRHRRHRPFLACFVDVRGRDGEAQLARCVRSRPTERYVLVLGPWQRFHGGQDGAGGAFGYLREPFGAPEVRTWVHRAMDEARHGRGDQSLEDLLYARFRTFLQNLGSQPMDSLHDLVWERVERPLLTAVLERTDGNQSRAAEILGIHRNTLRAKIRSLNIETTRRPRS